MQALVIDDDNRVRLTVALMLGEMGFDVLQANTGTAGIAILRTQQPDLVVTDIIMPDKEGIATIKEIKSDHPAAKIIAMSGSGYDHGAGFLAQALALGVEAILSKPFDDVDLAEAVRKTSLL